MVSTYASYQLLARDIDRSLATVSKQPAVARETAYFNENIGNVKTVEEFVGDSRLFNYAMKAHGLSDMAYAKAFMIKMLNEGVSEPTAFANKLTDKRYAEFVKTFNFAARGEEAVNFSPARDGTAAKYQIEAFNNGVDPLNETLQAQVKYFKENIVKVTSVDEFMAATDLYGIAMKAYGLGDRIEDTAFMRQILEEGVSDPDSLANRQTDAKYAEFASVFNFAERGAGTTTYRPAVEGTTESYMRQTLEENAGQQNDGVRLALYFERKAPSLTSTFQILGDKALAEVVRTALGLPDAFASADVDRQVAAIENRLDIADLKDPEKLASFISRFTAMYEMKNNMSSTPNISLLLQPSTGFGLSTDMLMTLQKLRG
ncbi:MAG: DUF1217 domain-containing protein [Rhizobiaceae bacterium]|nr:DUF1217 domain-containing protein [Rhizobiaceae bacterium]